MLIFRHPSRTRWSCDCQECIRKSRWNFEIQRRNTVCIWWMVRCGVWGCNGQEWRISKRSQVGISYFYFLRRFYIPLISYRYFKCPPMHGIFVPSSKVVISPLARKMRLSRQNSQESLTSNLTLNSLASTNASKLRMSATQKVPVVWVPVTALNFLHLFIPVAYFWWFCFKILEFNFTNKTDLHDNSHNLIFEKFQWLFCSVSRHLISHHRQRQHQSPRFRCR